MSPKDKDYMKSVNYTLISVKCCKSCKAWNRHPSIIDKGVCTCNKITSLTDWNGYCNKWN